MDGEVQDVTQAENTAEASSAENQSVETNQEVTDTQEDSNTQSKTVPYERFQEVIQSRKGLEAKIDQLAKQLETVTSPKTQAQPPTENEQKIQQELARHLEQMGYVKKTDLTREKADRELEDSMNSLGKKYDGKDGRPKFEKTQVLEYAAENLIGNLEVAYKQMNEAALLDHAVKIALGKTKNTRSEVSDGSGSSQAGTTQNDLVHAAHSGDSDAIKTLLKRAMS